MREIKFYGIVIGWNIGAIVANMRAIVKKDIVTMSDLVVMDLLRGRFANIVKDPLLKDRQVSRGGFATTGVTLYGVLVTLGGLVPQIIRMVNVMKGNLLELRFNLESGVRLFLGGTTIPVKCAEIIRAEISRQTILNHLPYFQNYDLTSQMGGHFVRGVIN